MPLQRGMMFAGHDVQLSNAPPRGGRLRRWWRLPPPDEPGAVYLMAKPRGGHLGPMCRSQGSTSSALAYYTVSPGRT